MRCCLSIGQSLGKQIESRGKEDIKHFFRLVIHIRRLKLMIFIAFFSLMFFLPLKVLQELRKANTKLEDKLEVLEERLNNSKIKI